MSLRRSRRRLWQSQTSQYKNRLFSWEHLSLETAGIRNKMLFHCHCEPTEGRRGSLNLNEPKTVYFLRSSPAPIRHEAKLNWCWTTKQSPSYYNEKFENTKVQICPLQIFYAGRCDIGLLNSSCCPNSICHSRGSGNPAFSLWNPAFAGVTSSVFVFRNRL